MRPIRLIILVGYLLLILQTILSTMFIGSIEARISFMTKLKILALFALAKKVDVLPLPLPIPIPIHIDDKDELVHMDSTPHGYYHRPPNYYHHYHYYNRPKIQAPYLYSTGSASGNGGGYYTAYASELSPVAVANHPIPLRYGDRISANHRPTYNIRKFRNRPISKPGLSDPKTVRQISGNDNSIYKQNSPTLEIQPPISTTVTPLSIQSTAGLNNTFENTTTASTINGDSQGNNLDNVNLKDIKIIFIPIKSLAAKKNENNEMVSDMKKFSDELSNQLNSNENSHTHYDNEDYITETDHESNAEQQQSPGKSIDYTRLIKDYIAHTNNTNNSTLSNTYSIDPILPEEPKLFKIEPNITTTSTTTITPVTTSTTTTINPNQDDLLENKQPTKPEIAVTGFEIPSLQDLWLKQNQYVPRASYYRAPKLKVYHHLKTQPPYYDDDNHYPYGRQANSANLASNYNSKPIYNQWLRTPNTMPVHNANNVQFLYTITHNNNNNNNNNNYPRQPLMASTQEYPIADRKFGLENYHQTANMFSHLQKPIRLYADNNQPDGKLITSSSIIRNWIQPTSHNYSRKPLLNGV